MRYRVVEDTQPEALENIRLHNPKLGPWNLSGSIDYQWHDTELKTLTINHLTWVPLGQEVVLYQAYIAYQAYFNESTSNTVEEIYDQYGIEEAQYKTGILAFCAFKTGLDPSSIPGQITALQEGQQADPEWKQSIIAFADCFSSVFESPETQGLPKFMIETKCDIKQEIAQAMDQLSDIRPVNDSLLEYAKELSRIEDMEEFRDSIGWSEVDDLARATFRLQIYNARQLKWKHKGYIIRRESKNSFHEELPKEFCVQHLTANLAKYLHEYTRMDITEVYFLESSQSIISISAFQEKGVLPVQQVTGSKTRTSRIQVRSSQYRRLPTTESSQ